MEEIKPSKMNLQIPVKPVEEFGPSAPLEAEEVHVEKQSQFSKTNANGVGEKRSTSLKLDGKGTELDDLTSTHMDCTDKHEPVTSETSAEESGRERLKRHRIEMAGRVWIPEIWGQEELLKDWIDCSAFDASLFPNGIVSARAALVGEGRKANSGRLRIENRC